MLIDTKPRLLLCGAEGEKGRGLGDTASPPPSVAFLPPQVRRRSHATAAPLSGGVFRV